jgi:predicted nuclease with TOPRIM domain
MSTTRKMLKAENTQLRAQLDAVEHESRTRRAERLHQLEDTLKKRGDQLTALQMAHERLIDELDKANHKIDELLAEALERVAA